MMSMHSQFSLGQTLEEETLSLHLCKVLGLWIVKENDQGIIYGPIKL